MKEVLDITNSIGEKIIRMGNKMVAKSYCFGVYEPPIPEKLKQLIVEKDEKIR